MILKVPLFQVTTACRHQSYSDVAYMSTAMSLWLKNSTEMLLTDWRWIHSDSRAQLYRI